MLEDWYGIFGRSDQMELLSAKLGREIDMTSIEL